jgi:hypothetical protein
MSEKRQQILLILAGINTAVIVLVGAIVAYAMFAIRHGW